MCGIAGITRTNRNIDHSEIQRMTDAIAHRGPDGEGFFISKNIAFGHRRLAIIDLATGKQPMCNEDETIWITMNGEIYNYLQLRRELIICGHQFKTASDTEVIIHAYEQWAEDCVTHFRGMFAFCIADLLKNKLFLARDHFGIKPLYYRIGKNYFGFASELNALRQIDDEEPKGCLQSVDFFLRFQYIPSPNTIFKDVFKLPPAYYLVVINSRIKKKINYWKLKFSENNDLNEDQWLEKADDVISQSVQSHLMSDVPFGVFLSGGVDSTLIAMKMRKLLQSPLKAFSIGFDEQEYSELKYALQAAQKIGVDFHYEIVKPAPFELLSDLVYQHGEPFGDSSMLPTWQVSKLARSFVPMVLSGDGGDEGFGGYQSYMAWMQHPLKAKKKLLIKAIKMLIKIHPCQANMILNEFSNYNQVDEWQKFITYLNLGNRLNLWNPEYQFLAKTHCDLFMEASKEAIRFDKLAYAQFMDLQTYLPCCILTKVDIASMQHGLEVRPPFIDIEVAEIFTNLPNTMRYREVESQYVGKYLLKKILSKNFDNKFVYRPKQGFAIPRQNWFLKNGRWRKYLEETLLHSNTPLNNWFSKNYLEILLRDHSEFNDLSNQLWLIFVLGIWLGKNKDITFS